MILNIDMDGKEVVVTRTAGPKLDQKGEQRMSKTTGEPMWSTQVVVTDDSGGEVISVSTTGEEPPSVRLGDPVELINLVALPWSTNGRGGIAFRADDIKVLDD